MGYNKTCSITVVGYPEHMTFAEFRRRYHGLAIGEVTDGPPSNNQLVQSVLSSQGVDSNSFKVGLSQAFFRAGTLARLDRQVEEGSHDTMVLFQVHTNFLCVCTYSMSACVLTYFRLYVLKYLIIHV